MHAGPGPRLGPVPRRPLLTAALLLLSGCGASGTDAPSPAVTTPPPVTTAPGETARATACLPTADATGNRLAAGTGDVPGAEPVDVELPGVPAWVTALPRDRWAVALEDGRVVLVEDGAVRERALGRLPAGQPPAFVCAAPTPLGDGSPRTHPLPRDDGFAVVQREGAVTLGGERASVDALPDARPVADGRGVAVFAGATDRYAHGVLGDELEAGEVARLRLRAGRLEVRRTPVPDGLVAEGQGPIAADADGDGEDDLVMVLSDERDGGRPAALTAGGWRIGDGLGQGFRWRHPVAVGPFGPDGEIELAVGRTPHLDGGIEFLALRGTRWTSVATEPGLTTHRLGSANLDQAVAGDFDGDGRPEVVAMAPGRDALAGVARDGDGAREAWRVSAGGEIVTNLAPSADPADGLALAAGTADRRLRIWAPPPAR